MSRPPTTPLTLYTFAMSHYSEKIRWTLDASQIAFDEVCMTPVFHMVPALSMGRRGQTTLPILKTPSEAIQDSPRIIDWLAAAQRPFPLLPDHLASEVRAVERRFDAIGKDVARALYAGGFGQADAQIRDLWTAHASPFQALVVRAGYPLIRWGFKQKLQIHAQRTALAQQRISEVMDWLEDRVAHNGLYLVGERFTVADITAAALLAPIACPTEHPVYSAASYRDGMAGAVKPWLGRPALTWVREVYARHRGTVGGSALRSPAQAA